MNYVNSEEYSFVLHYELNVGESKMWRDCMIENTDLVHYYKSNHDQIKIDAKGNVSMCYVSILDDNSTNSINTKKKEDNQ